MQYSNNELNYFRICYITTNIITEGLRSVFKQEWNTRYQALLGDWQDTAKNGVDFDNQETPASKKKNKISLTTMKNGNTKEWDCTTLFFGIRYSDSIGATLNPAISSHVNNLRLFRNKAFAHVVEGRISNDDFQHLVGVVETAFTGLNLAVDAIRSIANQEDFPTKEAENLKKEMQALKEECDALKEKSDALEEELKSTPKSFLGALPLKPSHVIHKREQEVSRIIKQLKDLSENSDEEVKTIYLSGNPGCGKSQLAREVGEEIYRQESSDKTFFVSTLNAESEDTMVNSYSKLARALGCTEYAVTKISISSDLTVQQKLEQFQNLVAPKLKGFPSWLLIVDGVVDLKLVRKYWPASGSKEYGAGKVIVTTQDQSAVPESSELSHNIILSKGMQVADAVSLLTLTSQMPYERNVLSVAKALDHQPLALAFAGLYMKSVRSHGAPTFTWKDYLQKQDKVEKEMGEAMKCVMGYPNSMPIAIKMAVDSAICEEVLFHSFQLISVCASSPIPLEAVVQYVRKRMSVLDNEEIQAKLTKCSLLNFDSNENTLCFHQVLHRVIKTDENLYLTTVKAFEVIAAAFESILSMAGEESTRRKGFVEHVNGFLHYVNMIHSMHTNFYGELGNFTELSVFFKWFISMAETCLEYGKMTVVKQCLENVLSFIQENACMEENSSVGDSLSLRLLFFCGYVLYELCDYSRALEYYNRSLNQCRKIHGGIIHKNVADCLLSLGNIHYSLCHYTEAIKCYEEALSIYSQLYGEKDKRVASCLLNLGSVKNNLSQYEQAERFYKRALHIRCEVNGENHPAVALCLQHLGTVKLNLSQYEQAERFYQRAQCIYREVYGENHQTVAGCLLRLGEVNTELSYYEQAKRLYEQALNIYRKVYVENHLDVAHCLQLLGNNNVDLSQYEQADRFYQQAFCIYHKVYVENHPNVANCLAGFGRVHLGCCRFYVAKGLFERCLPIFIDVGDQCKVGYCLHYLGLVSEGLDDLETSVEFFTRALDTRRRFLPENHPHIKKSIEELDRVTKKMAAAKKRKNDNRSQRTEQKKTNERQEETEEKLKCILV